MKKNQAQRVLEYIQEHGGISSYVAFTQLGITRLSGRIFDLKRQGYKFRKIRAHGANEYGKYFYDVYTLEEADNG